jgi:hypothetical protein
MENITSVVVDPHPDRKLLGEQWVQCTPDLGYVAVDIGDIKKGDMYLFIFTQMNSVTSNCTDTSLAYAMLCMFEDETNTPLVAFINVCPQSNSLSAPHNQGNRERQLNYNYRIFLHELIHAMGMISPIVDTVTGITQKTGWVSIISLPVLNWARRHFNCSYIMGVPFIGGHWDPFFVGEAEIMTACIAEGAILSPVTLAFLDGVGPYRVLPHNLHHHSVIRRSRYGVGQGCTFVRIDQCGLNPENGVGVEDCLNFCVNPGTMIVVPNEVLGDHDGHQIFDFWGDMGEQYEGYTSSSAQRFVPNRGLGTMGLGLILMLGLFSV